jgi:hypothetical protein
MSGNGIVQYSSLSGSIVNNPVQNGTGGLTSLYENNQLSYIRSGGKQKRSTNRRLKKRKYKKRTRSKK